MFHFSLFLHFSSLYYLFFNIINMNNNTLSTVERGIQFENFVFKKLKSMNLYVIENLRNTYTSKFYKISYETLRNTIQNFTKYHLSKFIRQNFTKYHTKLYEIPYETLRNTIRNFTKYHLSKF